MMDETIVLETPPLTYCYSRIGEQRRVLIAGGHARRILHGTLNIQSGEVLLWHSPLWTQMEHQSFLHMIRSHWRGWHIILFEDRASQHTANNSQVLAETLDIQVRFLPRATPELNVMDHLWRHTKREGISNRETSTVLQSAEMACDYIRTMSPRERLQKAGVFSDNFWLAE